MRMAGRFVNMSTLSQQLQKNQLRQSWVAIINRLYELKRKWPCGASTRFGPGTWKMECAFRTWEDHFTVWHGDKVVCSFTLDFRGEIAVEFSAI